MYKILDWLHLEYCAQRWSPLDRSDVEALERVQIRFTRLLPGLEFTRYDDRVGKHRLFLLVFQRASGECDGI